MHFVSFTIASALTPLSFRFRFIENLVATEALLAALGFAIEYTGRPLVSHIGTVACIEHVGFFAFESGTVLAELDTAITQAVALRAFLAINHSSGPVMPRNAALVVPTNFFPVVAVDPDDVVLVALLVGNLNKVTASVAAEGPVVVR